MNSKAVTIWTSSYSNVHRTTWDALPNQMVSITEFCVSLCLFIYLEIYNIIIAACVCVRITMILKIHKIFVLLVNLRGKSSALLHQMIKNSCGTSRCMVSGCHKNVFGQNINSIYIKQKTFYNHHKITSFKHPHN